VMNPIKNIEIKNFKSIQHLKIDGCKRINVFIGYPNVGKSNILEALSLFSIRQPFINVSALVRMEKPTTLFFNGDIENRMEAIVNDEYLLAGKYKHGQVDFVFEIDSHKRGFNGWSESGLNDRFPRIFSFTLKDRSILDWKDNLAINAENTLYSVKKYEFNKSITYKAGSEEVLADPYGENIFSVIYANDKLIKESLELFKEYGLDLLYDSRDQNFIILKKFKEGLLSFSIPYDLVADTLRRLIFYAAAIMTNKDSVLLFEEPEAHMFPPYMKKFTADVIFDKTNQFFIATHSPYILESFMMDAEEDLSIYLVSYEDGHTKVKLMKDEDIEEVKKYGVDLFYNLESYLKHGQVNID
jgi:AAA15 family ATPase/GTPase